jgi:hypothetical protein
LTNVLGGPSSITVHGPRRCSRCPRLRLLLSPRGHRFNARGSYPTPSTARRSQRNLCPSLWQTVDQHATVYAVLEEEGTRRPPRMPCWSRPPRTPSLCTKTRTKVAPSTSYAVEPVVAVVIAVELVVAKKLGGDGPGWTPPSSVTAHKGSCTIN